ncbi:MAG: tyrosine-type recombinase/integrase [Sulfurimonas sp.]|jgi:integrase
MKKLRFKNRNGILYFGIDGYFKSSKLKYTNINKNIIIGKFKDGRLDEELGIAHIDNIPTVNQLLDEVMSSKLAVLKFKTMRTYEVISRLRVRPYFKDTLVNQVKPIDIKKFQDHLISLGFSKGVLQLARVLLKEVFSIAILNEWITLNPIKMVDMPKLNIVKKKTKPFTLDEIDLILKNTKGVLKNFLGISFFTGMRSGEVLALKWEDIDFVTDTISINKTIAEGHINSPKTKSSMRDIEMLTKAKEFFKAQQLETGIQNSYMFLTKYNNYYSNNSYFYQNYQKVLKKLGLDARSLHHTRHTFASIMLNNRIEPLWVSNILGHENLDMTLKVYTHFMPRKEKMSLEFLEKRYKNGTVGA